MDLSWLWQNLLTNILWLVFMGIGTAVVATLKAKKPTVAAPVLYGLGALACLSILFYTATGRSLFTPAPTSQSNIENSVKRWVSSFGYGSDSIASPVSSSDFAYQVTPAQPRGPLTIWRDKNKPGYLQLETTISVSPEHAAILKRITPIQALEIAQNTESELLRRNLSFGFSGPDLNHIQQITIIKAVPIDGLTESQFGYAIDDIEAATEIAKLAFVDSLEKYGAAITMPQTQ